MPVSVQKTIWSTSGDENNLIIEDAILYDYTWLIIDFISFTMLVETLFDSIFIEL